MRALAVSSDERLNGIAVPTMRESGIDVVLYNWRAAFAPPGIPDEHRAQLEALIDAMARSAEWERETGQREWQRIYLPRAEFVAFLDTETRSVECVLRRLGLAG